MDLLTRGSTSRAASSDRHKQVFVIQCRGLIKVCPSLFFNSSMAGWLVVDPPGEHHGFVHIMNIHEFDIFTSNS
jgi:hypothetical protein